MTTPSQLGTLRGEIDDIKAKILKTEEALAAAEALADISFWRKRLGDLDKEKIILREQETILLQGQASGEHRLPCYLFAITWLRLAKLHAHLSHVLIFQGLTSPGEYYQIYTVVKRHA